MSENNVVLEVDRSDRTKTRIVEQATGELAPDSVRLSIDRFALTANNVTYAVIGEMLGYWNFFPAEGGWGRVPAMGWGTVVESTHADIETGGKYYGWFPMARTVDLRAVPAREGLRDDGEHRAEHAAVYRTYTASDRDPFYAPGDDAENRHALLRGLFVTAFLADDFLGCSDYYGAKRLVVLSASSKTAIGLAERARLRGVGDVVGVTSARNAEFVRGLGCYDRVVDCEAIDSLPVDQDAVCVDMAGNGATLERVHARLDERLRYSMSIGLSHHDATPAAPPSRGPAPELFFAPTQVDKRMADWGAEGYRQRVADALEAFVESSRGWLEVRELRGGAGAADAWNAALEGAVPPHVGQIVSLHDASS